MSWSLFVEGSLFTVFRVTGMMHVSTQSEAENQLWEHKVLSAYHRHCRYLWGFADYTPLLLCLLQSRLLSIFLSLSVWQLCTLRLGEPSLNQWTDVGLGMEQNKNKQTGESPFRLCCRISWMSACRCCFWAAEACRVQYALLSWDSEASVWCHKQDGHPGHFLPKYNHFTYGKNTLLKWRLILRFST